MIDRRSFFAGIVAMTVAAPVFAQHQDLGTDEPDADVPIQRRCMMEDRNGNVVTNEDMLGKFTLI